MAEYIERERLIDKANNLLGGSFSAGLIYEAIEKAPTADVVEVRHGECLICNGEKDIKQDCDNGYYVEIDREQREMSVWLGDECLAVFSIDYCPNCGAKMDGFRSDSKGESI